MSVHAAKPPQTARAHAAPPSVAKAPAVKGLWMPLGPCEESGARAARAATEAAVEEVVPVNVNITHVTAPPSPSRAHAAPPSVAKAPAVKGLWMPLGPCEESGARAARAMASGAVFEVVRAARTR